MSINRSNSAVYPRLPDGRGAPLLRGFVLVLLAVALAACTNKEGVGKSGQALASVDGKEITSSQLNDEIQRRGTVTDPVKQTKEIDQLLDSLVERQLIVNAAIQEQVDRDPQVVRAIERSKALLIAQAYVQKKLNADFKPSADEVGAYYTANPQFFADRKQLNIRQLVLDDITPGVKAAIENAKTLEDVAAYLDAHQLRYGRNTITRSTSDFPKDMSEKLMSMSQAQLFLVREGNRNVLNVVMEIRDAPVSREVAAPQIEQFLAASKKQKALAQEVALLRSAAKIDYFNKPAADAPPPKAAAVDGDAIARAVSGMK